MSGIWQSVKNCCNKITYQKTKDGLKVWINDNVWNTNNVNPSKKAVLITGCDHGFGNLLAKKLDSQGFHVFASCLNPAHSGATKLKSECSKRLKILPLDVRKEDSVEDAVKFVKSNLGTSKLFAVVNNAGIRKGSSFDFSSIDDYKECLDVNTLGVIRVTKAFLPMLKKSQGKVVNVTCILGRIALPHCSAYAMSQFAAAAFNDCIRQELMFWGVRVICVEPEWFQTETTNSDAVLKQIDDALSTTDKSVLALYGTDYLKRFKLYAKSYASLASKNMDIVLKDLQLAINQQVPWPSYRPTRNALMKFLYWDYESKVHVNRDALHRLICTITKFPKPEAVEEREQKRHKEYIAKKYEEQDQESRVAKDKKSS